MKGGRYYIISTLWIFLSGISSLNGQDVVINEIMSSNNNTVQDEDGDYPDWIELYNTTASDIDLKDWILSDDWDDEEKWIFPSITIPAKGFLLVFASDKDRRTPPYLHTNFKIKSDGEPIILYGPGSVLVDSYPPVGLSSDESYGRLPDGGAEFENFDSPTPGYSNTNIPAIEITWSHEAGWYGDSIAITVNANHPEFVLKYTRDGSVPGWDDSTWNSPLVLFPRKGEANGISNISTSAEYWEPPEGEVYKIHTIRIAAFYEGEQVGDISTRSYIIDEYPIAGYPVPVVSIVGEPAGFFGDTSGILVPGSQHIGGDLQTGNYYMRGREWERLVSFEYFDALGGIQKQVDVGTRVHGAFSRQLPQKSMRLYARSEYGTSRFGFPFFNQKEEITDYKRLIVRAANPNNFHVPFKDELIHLLAREMGMDYQAYQPVVGFVNGEYWGLFNLKERHDEYYIQNNYGLDPDEVNVLEQRGAIVEGDNSSFFELVEYARNHDLSQNEHYDWVSEHMDIHSYMDYLILQLYLGAHDFPENNQVYWQSDEYDAKWRWLFKDGDSGMHEYWRDNLEVFFGGEPVDSEEEPFLVLSRSLVKNEAFKNEFSARFIYHLNDVLSPRNVLPKIDSLTKVYDPLMPQHVKRWSYPESFNDYRAGVEHLQTFAALRPGTLKGILENVLGKPYFIGPNPMQDFLFIYFNDSPEGGMPYRWYDVSGRKIGEGETAANGQVEYFPDRKGVFYLHFRIGDFWYVEPIEVR